MELKNTKYYWLDARTGEFDKVNGDEFNKLQFTQQFIWGKSLYHVSDTGIFGGDGRYTVECFIDMVEKFK